MTLIKKFDNFINEAYKGDPKKYKQWWDKGPETQIRRTFGKEYEKAIDNRVKLLLTLVDDPDKAEEYAEMDFLSLPNGISTQLVNMDPKELHTILDESVTEAKGESNEELMFNFLEALRASGATNMFGAAPYLQDSFGLSKSEAKKVLIKWMKSYESVAEGHEFKHINKDEHKIKLAIKDVEKKVKLKANRGNPIEYDQLSLNKIMLSKVLGRGKLDKEHQDAWEKLKKEYDLKESINEARANTAKEALRNASDALTQTIPGSKLNKSYVKDYLKSLERMAKKAPQLFVKQYGDFTINDYLEDVEYNMANESVNEAKKDLKIGDTGVDYNDNTVEVIEIGNFNKVSKSFKKQMKADAEDYGYEKSSGDFYLTKNIEATEGNVGDLAIYPVKYDMANYWGLEPIKESLVTEAKVTEKTIDGLTNKLAKIVKELKENFLLYKGAKNDADKKKWTKRAGELTKLKQLVDSELEQAIQSFHKDIEYDEAYETFSYYESLLESTIGIKTDGTASVKGIQKLRDDLDKAKIKHKFNRLSMTLSVIDTDKKFFADAKKIVDDSGFAILMAKESKDGVYSFDEFLEEGSFSDWEVSFKSMNLSGTKLNPKNVYKVKARGTAEAIKKAAKDAGVKDDMWIATETNSIKKIS